MRYAACSRCRLGSKTTEQGAVLVMALLIMSLVAALTVYLAAGFELNTRRAGNRVVGAQNLLYVQSAEQLAKHFLAKDENRQIDHLGEDWNAPLNFSPGEQEGNIFAGWLEDAQGRFNLNSLNEKAPANSPLEGPAKRFTASQRRFIRLLQTFDEVPISESEAIELTEAIIDWLDEDGNVTGMGGAEALDYADLGYEPANGPMFSVSELQQVRHMTPELFNLLREFCVVLPDKTALNINTAPPRLMRTLNRMESLTPLSEAEGEELASERSGEGFQDVQELLATPLLESFRQGGGISSENLSVNSSYFLLHSEAYVEERLLRTDSLLRRNDKGIVVVWRSRGRL